MTFAGAWKRKDKCKERKAVYRIKFKITDIKLCTP